MIAIEANGGNKYDKMERVKSDTAARGIASLLNDGSNEKVVLAKEIYGAQIVRMNAMDKLRRMNSDGQAG